MARKNLYEPGTGTPEGYRWVTIREDRPHSALEYQHILVRTDDGEIVSGPRALRGANLHVVAPATAKRHKIGGADKLRKNKMWHDELRRIATERQDMTRDAKHEAALEYEEQKHAPSVIQHILGTAGKAKWSKDYPDRGDIPLVLLSKNGQPLDSAATEAGFADADAMIEAIREDVRQRKRQATKSQLEERAVEQLHHSENWKMLDELEKMVREQLPPVRRVKHAKKRRKSA